MEDRFKKIRTDCWDRALDCLAYSYIYAKKVARIGFWLRWSKVLGFIIPVTLGGVVSGYYSNKLVMDVALLIATPIGLIQLIVSGVLTSSGSDDIIISHMRKSTEFGLLNVEFEQLANYPPENLDELNHRFQLLVERENGLSKDLLDVTDEDKRMGMRYGLRNYKRDCVKCGEVPYDMTPTDCPVCGKFKPRLI